MRFSEVLSFRVIISSADLTNRDLLSSQVTKVLNCGTKRLLH